MPLTDEQTELVESVREILRQTQDPRLPNEERVRCLHAATSSIEVLRESVEDAMRREE